LVVGPIASEGLQAKKSIRAASGSVSCRTPVRDAELAYLRGLRGLYQLNLDATKVTDAGLVHLKGLTQLEELFLDSSRITDAGLEHLRGLTQLRTVDLRNTQVTDKGVSELKKALPNCEIFR
jgi:internalin A